MRLPVGCDLPYGSQVVRITGAGETLHAKWFEVTDADVTAAGRMQIPHGRRMLRFHAIQLWQNLQRLGWVQCRCPRSGDKKPPSRSTWGFVSFPDPFMAVVGPWAQGSAGAPSS